MVPVDQQQMQIPRSKNLKETTKQYRIYGSYSSTRPLIIALHAYYKGNSDDMLMTVP